MSSHRNPHFSRNSHGSSRLDQRQAWNRGPNTKWILLVLVACGTQLPFLAQTPPEASPQKTAVAQRIESAILVDGELSESEWTQAQVLTDFIQQEPRTGEPATERTEIRLLYDHENFYVGITCFDSEGGEAVMVNDLVRDFRPFESDTLLMVLDTFDDDRNGFLFNVNAGGAKFDLQFRDNGRRRNRDWDGIWHAKSRITDFGWQAELAIPFKTLRFSGADEQVWGINFQRRVRRTNEASQWSLVPRPFFPSRISYAGRLEGLQGIQPGRNLYLKPYVSLPVLRRQGDDVDLEPDAGLDVKYGLTPQLTLDLTVNTDFSQVEADEQQINLTRFNLFLPGKAGVLLGKRRPVPVWSRQRRRV